MFVKWTKDWYHGAVYKETCARLCFRRKLAWTRNVELRERAKSEFLLECETLEPSSTTAPVDNADDDFVVFESHDSLPYLSYLNGPIASLQSLTDYPVVKKVFMRFNATLPSSAAVERLFSCAGLILTPNRARVTDGHFEAKVLLKFNRPKQ
jgi:hypothetical protein